MKTFPKRSNCHEGVISLFLTIGKSFHFVHLECDQLDTVQATVETLSPIQTVATFQYNISRHCWPSICKPRPNDGNISTQHIATFDHPVATSCDMLGIENRTRAYARAQH